MDVTAGDILTDSDIEIVNKDHYLFSIAKGHSMRAVMTVKKDTAMFRLTKIKSMERQLAQLL